MSNFIDRFIMNCGPYRSGGYDRDTLIELSKEGVDPNVAFDQAVIAGNRIVLKKNRRWVGNRIFLAVSVVTLIIVGTNMITPAEVKSVVCKSPSQKHCITQPSTRN